MNSWSIIFLIVMAGGEIDVVESERRFPSRYNCEDNVQIVARQFYREGILVQDPETTIYGFCTTGAAEA